MLRVATNTPDSIARYDSRDRLPVAASTTYTASLGVGQLISWGTLYYSYPLIAESLSHELRLSKQDIYGAATIGLLVSACLNYPIAKAIDRGHGREILAGGSLFAALLLILWSQVKAPSLFFGIVLLLGVAQSMTLYDAVFAVIAKHASKRLIAHSIARVTLWGGFASTIFIPLVEFLLQHIGWRETLIVSGIFNVVVAMLYFLNIRKRESPARINSFHRTTDRETRPVSLRTSPVLRALIICFSLHSLIFTGLLFHLYPLFAMRELSSSTLAGAMAILGPAQVLGRIFMWRFSTTINLSQVGRVVMLAFPLSILSILLLPPFLALVTFVIVYGTANGMMTILRGTAVPELLTMHNYGAINSFISVTATVCKALGPFAIAYAFGLFGSYDFPMVGILFLSIGIIVSYWRATSNIKLVLKTDFDHR